MGFKQNGDNRRVNELEDRSVGIIQTEQQRKKDWGWGFGGMNRN